MKTNGNSLPSLKYTNDTDDIFAKKQLHRQIVSNLFFELGTQNNRSQQVNVAYDLYKGELLSSKHKQTINQTKLSQFRNKIVNDMNEVYRKIIHNSPIPSNQPTSINAYHDKYNEIVSMINSPQSNFFTTEIERYNKIKTQSSNPRRLSSQQQNQDKSISCSLDFNVDNKLEFQKRPTIVVLLKGNNRSRRIKFNSELKKNNHSNEIEFKEIKPDLPSLKEQLIKEGLRKYEMQDQLLALKKPQFKY